MIQYAYLLTISLGLAFGLVACAGRGRVTPYDLGVTLQDQGKLAEAIEHYNEMLAENPHHLRARFNLAVIYHDQQKYPAAKREYRYLLQQHPDHARSLINLADIAEAEGRPGQAHMVLLQATDAAPDQPYVYSYLGRYLHLQRHNRLTEAQQAYERALAIEPDALTHYRLGMLWLQRRDAAIARKHFSKAIQLDPNERKSLRQLATLAMQTGERTEAERYLQRLTHLTPLDAEVFRLLGVLYMQQQQYSSAVLHLWEARDLQPNSHKTERLLLQVYEKLLQHQKDTLTPRSIVSSPPAANAARDGVNPQNQTH
jgi:tetratricopeptide (TPR) repeat protein